jgi:hypothetical protein
MFFSPDCEDETYRLRAWAQRRGNSSATKLFVRFVQIAACPRSGFAGECPAYRSLSHALDGVE